jgi:hypothetical protein
MTQNKTVKSVPYHAKQALRGSGVITPAILNLGAGLGWMVNTMPRLLYPQERDIALIVWET